MTLPDGTEISNVEIRAITSIVNIQYSSVQYSLYSFIHQIFIRLQFKGLFPGK